MKPLRLISIVSLLAFLPALSALAIEPRFAGDDGQGPQTPPQRYVVADAQHVLSPAEKGELEAKGWKVLSALGGTRYLVRQSAAADGDAGIPFRSIERIRANQKFDRSARREMARFGSAAHLRLLFQPDVDFASAKALIEDAGGWIQDPLRTRFAPLGRIDAVIPGSAIAALAEQEDVARILGPSPRLVAWNAASAQVSSVDQVQAAPYNLDGSGVTVSVWDVGSADANHKEFEGRLIAEDIGSASVADHPTHTSGTIGAAGILPDAKGMAPAVHLQQYDIFTGDLLVRKDEAFGESVISADNNSWGDVEGWYQDTKGWIWYGFDEYFGAYTYESAALDYLSRNHPTTMVFSSGNANADAGPSTAPFQHYHGDESRPYCYSSDGSGTDCPTTCTCETEHHPANGPFQSLGIYASAKNTLTVGASLQSGTIVSFSSTGPAQDGRIKPEVVALGFNVNSSVPRNGYAKASGTSMAAPVVTGISALLAQQWHLTMEGEPSPAVIRGLLIQERRGCRKSRARLHLGIRTGRGEACRQHHPRRWWQRPPHHLGECHAGIDHRSPHDARCSRGGEAHPGLGRSGGRGHRGGRRQPRPDQQPRPGNGRSGRDDSPLDSRPEQSGRGCLPGPEFAGQCRTDHRRCTGGRLHDQGHRKRRAGRSPAFLPDSNQENDDTGPPAASSTSRMTTWRPHGDCSALARPSLESSATRAMSTTTVSWCVTVGSSR